MPLVSILCRDSDHPAAGVAAVTAQSSTLQLGFAAVTAQSSRAAPRVTNSWNRPVCAPRQLLGAISELYCGTTCAKSWVLGCLPTLSPASSQRLWS